MTKSLHVLQVEDNESDAELIVRLLEKAGYDVQAERVETAVRMHAALTRQTWDVVIADYRLPQFDAPSALATLRKTGIDIPFIVVSGTIGEELAVTMMKAGAQDYLMKDNLARLAPAVEREIAEVQTRRARRQAEQALRESERRYRLISENSGDVIWTMDVTSGRLTYVSPSVQRLLGYTVAEIMTQPLDVLLPPGAGQRAIHALHQRLQALESGHESARIQTHELELRHQDGSLVATEVVTTILTGAADGIREIVGVAHNITSRKRAEMALRESSQLNQQIIAHAREGIIVYGPDLHYKLWNPFMERLSGLPAAQVLGRHPAEVFPILREAGVIHALEQALRGESTRPLEFSVPDPHTGKPVWLSDTNGPLRNTAGEVIGVIGVVRNITEQKLLEDQLRQAQKMEAIGQLAGGVAHDYNNILTAILIQLGLLLGRPSLEPAMRNVLLELENAAKRAANLTRQLLLFSRRQVIQIKPVDLNEVLTNLTDMLRRLLGESISLEFKGSGTPLWVEADVGMMEQVVMNFCVNARDAMLPKGGRLAIEARRVELNDEVKATNPEARAGRFARLTVTDTGCGMDAPTLQRIFEPFFTTKEVGKGTGLGLATVYGIVKQHQGWIEVHSRPSQGSTFRVFIPALPAAPSARPKTDPPRKQRGTETVLLVEDEVMVRQIVAMSLRWHGYQVIEAGDGPEAIRIWEQRAPEIDLLFTDMVMPGGITGLELLKRFKQDKPTLKAVISSGYSVELTTSEPPTGPGIAYLTKPYEVTALANVLRDCLDQKPSAPPENKS